MTPFGQRCENLPVDEEKAGRSRGVSKTVAIVSLHAKSGINPGTDGLISGVYDEWREGGREV